MNVFLPNIAQSTMKRKVSLDDFGVVQMSFRLIKSTLNEIVYNPIAL